MILLPEMARGRLMVPFAERGPIAYIWRMERRLPFIAAAGAAVLLGVAAFFWVGTADAVYLDSIAAFVAGCL